MGIKEEHAAYLERWKMFAEKRGHTLEVILPGEDDFDGEVGKTNWWADAGDIHNGPRCTKCGYTWCVWCTRPEDIKDCTCGGDNDR